MLGSAVDIWEVGNEVNGNWLSNKSNGADVMPKIEAMYSIVTAQGGRTALTFFYEGEPSDPNNCIATDHGGNDMFTWITTNFSLNLPVSQRPVATEAIRTGVNYVLISWYPADCPGEKPNWPAVYTKVASIFPQSQVGFGELGTDNPQDGSTYEDDDLAKFFDRVNHDRLLAAVAGRVSDRRVLRLESGISDGRCARWRAVRGK